MDRELEDIVRVWLAQESASLRGEVGQLQAAYARQKTSAHVGLAAYMATRLPATYAAVFEVLGRLQEVLPHFSPRSLLDLGCGPGTASWAGVGYYPDIALVQMVDIDQRFLESAQLFSQQSSVPALRNAQFHLGSLQALEKSFTAELVMAAYSLAEMPIATLNPVLGQIWAASEQLLVLVEPGTPAGFSRINIARDYLISVGASIIAPCTHHKNCPMQGPDWCHFKVRLNRSRIHRHAKMADVPYEDESFSYLIASRTHFNSGKASRIIAPVFAHKAYRQFRLCDYEGVYDRRVEKRDKIFYGQIRKLAWGDRVNLSRQ